MTAGWTEAAGGGNGTVAFDGRALDVDRAAYLSQHDIVYRTPGTEGYEGFPLGNGDLGVMGWAPADRLHFQINKCDTWDDGPDEPFGSWDDGHRANQYTALRHCGELRIVPGLPLFDWMYLEDFEGRLSLADAQGTWVAKGPLGEVRCRAFVTREPKVLVVQYQDRLSEPTVRQVRLARWGSRVFEHWYSVLKRDGHLGNGTTKAAASGDEVWIEHATRSLRFAVVCHIVADEAESRVAHTREAAFQLRGDTTCSFTLYLSVVTSEEAEGPLAAARKAVREAANLGADKVFETHKAFWADFWSKSFIDIPSDYLENLWYFNLYQVGSSSAGRYPPHFVQSIWSWNRDVRPWNHYYHWNQQSYTWPMMASGHPELLEPYARFRLEGLPHAIEDARTVHGCEGAFYSDVTNRRGYQDTLVPDDFNNTVDKDWLKTYVVLSNYNTTPGGQIAHDLYRHYQYTGDEAFLDAYTYPIMREWIRFMCDYVRLGEDGRYHVPRTDTYETTWVHCEDTTNALAYIRLLFPAFVELAARRSEDHDLAERAGTVVDRLAQYVYVSGKDVTSAALCPDEPLMAAGRYYRTGEPVFGGCRVAGRDVELGGFTMNTQLTPLFPTGLVNLDRCDSKDFQAVLNVMRAGGVSYAGHGTALIAAARLGLADQMEKALRQAVEGCQIFPSMHLRTDATNKVRVLEEGEFVDLPTRPFAGLGLEPGSIFETAIDDMLLAGYGDTIRVFPATPEQWDARFTLHAVGGFEVTSEKAAGEVKYVAVKSRLGKRCRVANPWGEGTEVSVMNVATHEQIGRHSDAVIVFATEPGFSYVIERTATPVSSFARVRITGEPNKDMKRLGVATLGIPRRF